MRLALVCFYCLCVFVYVLYFIATMSFAGYFLPVLFCMLSMLISDSRLIWFGSVYLVTTAGFVADQLMWENNNNNSRYTKPPSSRKWLDDDSSQTKHPTIINSREGSNNSKGRFSAYLLLIPLCDLQPSIASSTFRSTTVFGLFWIKLKTSICRSPSSPFFKSLTQTFWFYR